MSSAAAIRTEIETALAKRIPSALTPAPRIIRPVVATGIAVLDELLHGGLPVGAITEMAGPECSGRMSIALAFIAQITAAGKACAWIDVSDSLAPESAAAAGVLLDRLLWVRCGISRFQPPQPSESFTVPQRYFVPPLIKRGLHCGSFGVHPRSEVKGLSSAVNDLLRPTTLTPRYAEPQRCETPQREGLELATFRSTPQRNQTDVKPLTRIDQALRVTDLLLQAGGFGAIVFDMGSLAPEDVLRVPAATWFRYRSAAERTQASILLLTQHACAKSCAGLVLRMQPGEPQEQGSTVFAGMRYRVEVVRERFVPDAINVIQLRKPPCRDHKAGWLARAVWAGGR
jgi:recombination protein RecA